jgi:tetratricopeptide (TPR) repeat protein
VGELADQQRRLDLLDADGDSRTAVRAVFSWSYRHLPAAAARAFRLLGLHPAADLDAYAAAALTGTAVEQARHLLDQLTRVHLIQPTRPGRYGLHDLLRAYARELAAARDGQDHGQAALTRLFDHYLDTAAAAADTLFPADRRHRPRLSPPAAAIPPVTGDPVAARAWLDAERTGLVAVTAHSAGNGWPGHATRLAVTLFRYLETGGHCPEASTIHTCAREAARRTADAAAEATALTGLGIVAATQGRWLEAISQFADALDLYRGCGDRAGETRALGNLGIMNLRLGRYRAAAGHLAECLLLCRETGDRAAEARTLGNLGIVDLRLGRYEQANDCFARALSLSRDVGDWVGEAYALGNFGDLQLRRGLYQQSAGHFRQALDLFRRVGDQSGEAEILSGRTEPGLPCRFPPQAWRRGRTLLLPARHRCRHLRRRRKRPARRRRVRRYHDDHSLLSGSQGVSPKSWAHELTRPDT